MKIIYFVIILWNQIYKEILKNGIYLYKALSMWFAWLAEHLIIADQIIVQKKKKIDFLKYDG